MGHTRPIPAHRGGEHDAVRCRQDNLDLAEKAKNLASHAHRLEAQCRAALKENERLRRERDTRERDLDSERAIAQRRGRLLLEIKATIALGETDHLDADEILNGVCRLVGYDRPNEANPPALSPAVRVVEADDTAPSDTPRATTGDTRSHGHGTSAPSSVPVSRSVTAPLWPGVVAPAGGDLS